MSNELPKDTGLFPSTAIKTAAERPNAALKALMNRLDDQKREIEALTAALSKSRTRDSIYAAYFSISSSVSYKAPPEREGAIAHDVWENGGSGGITHKKSHSHWRESKVFGERFQAWGARCASMLSRHPRFDRGRDDLVIGEYGCGGGAVLLAMAPYAAELVAFDIAQSNLDETERALKEIGKPLIKVLVPENFSEIRVIPESLDVFLSFNVFQHLPSKAYALDVLCYAAQVMRPGAIGIIDIRFDNGNPKFAGAALDEYNSVTGHTFATSFRIDHFHELLEKCGMQVECIGALSKANGATFWFTKRGGRAEEPKMQLLEEKNESWRPDVKPADKEGIFDDKDFIIEKKNEEIKRLKGYIDLLDFYRFIVETAIPVHGYDDGHEYQVNYGSHPFNFNSPHKLLRYSFFQSTSDGFVAEFGVYKGLSLKHLASISNSPVHAFDTFTGLPIDWTPERPAGSYSTDGTMPDIPNVKYHVGLFADTIPKFLELETSPARFVHIDSDLYESCVDVLEGIKERIVVGTVIQFDDYFFSRWKTMEHRAFFEFCADYGVRYEVLGFAPGYSALSVIIRDIGKPYDGGVVNHPRTHCPKTLKADW